MLGVLLVTVGASQVLWGFSRGAIGRASTQGPATVVAGHTADGGLFVGDGTTVSAHPTPSRLIALTFDDGPDPRWTPQLLELLHRLGVPATFFVVGARVLEHPGLVQKEFQAGHDVGLHTYTHADLDTASAARQHVELALNQVALESAIGRRSLLVRMPYTSSVESISAANLSAAQRLQRGGYVVAFADRDGEDWRKGRAVPQIVAAATPSGNDGAIVLLHDGGGDRRRTLAATEALVTQLRARGDRFVTLSTMLGVPRDTVTPLASRGETLRADAFATAYRGSGDLAHAFTVLAILIAGLMFVRAALLLLFARRHVRGVRPNDAPASAISVVVPAFNEQAGIRATVGSLLASELAAGTALEVVVVDDGSTDDTAAMIDAMDDPRLLVVHQENAGKAVALNVGIAAASYDVIVTVDGDTVFEPTALARLVMPLADPDVGAVSGNTKVANRGGVLGKWQHIEYVIGFNLDRRMYDVLGCMPTVPGAIGAFRRDVLVAVGGFSTDTLAEDTDITMAIHRRGARVVYVDDAVAYTEAPTGLGDLWRQRYRWSYGTMQSMWKHTKGMVAGRERNRLGFIGLPYVLLFQVLLALVAPVVDVFSIIGLMFGNRALILGYWVAFTALQLGITVFALRSDGESLRSVWVVPLQQFVYRQLMYLVVIQSVVSAISGAHLPWHRVRRFGIEPSAEPAVPVPIR